MYYGKPNYVLLAILIDDKSLALAVSDEGNNNNKYPK